MKDQIVEELEELRIKLDTIIKQVSDHVAFDLLRQAKDYMGLAQLQLK
jgi:hypothetical protein